MNVDEALKYLEKKQITTSRQMLLRWVRQGKIDAKLPSRIKGYEIDPISLERFAMKKQISGTDGSIKKTSAYQLGFKDGEKAARLKDGEEIILRRELAIKYVIKDREKELINKGAYTDTIVVENSSKLPVASQRYMNAFEANQFTFRILGSWALVEETCDLIDIEYLDYPNRKLRTRLRDWIKTQIPEQ